MFQQRVVDPTLTNVRGIWVAPMRDVAHCFPYLFVQVAEMVRTDPDYAAISDKVEVYLRNIAAYIKDCIGEDAPDTVVDNSCKHHIIEADAAVQKLVGKWTLRVMLGFYWKCIRDAMHPGETPLGLSDLKKRIEVVNDNDGGPVGCPAAERSDAGGDAGSGAKDT